jgi:5-methylcytosine-specific restriction enzyme subunit McrC
MAKRLSIQVFEHQKLPWKQAGLRSEHIKRLIAWNEANGNQYFTVGFKSFTFTQYVGVIQVGDLVIEVLPKADRKEADSKATKVKWQNALLTMLRTVHDLPLTSTTDTHLKKRNNNVLDFFFGLFVSDVEDLVRRGLVKRYRRTKENCNALKGRIDFPRHLLQNLVHQERFFVEHQVYDTDHLLHALFKRALGIVEDLALDPFISGGAKGLDWAFEHVAERQLDAATLDRIVLDRKTEPYSRAIQLAKMIVLNHAPDLQGGHMPLIGLLFDMNVLFEEFVYRVLRKAARAPEHAAQQVSVRGQRSMLFWKRKTIRPDIVLEYVKDGHPKRVIVDTKWKVPPNGKPNDADLKQMFVYNVQFNAERSVLLYPAVDGSVDSEGTYITSSRLDPWAHRCEMRYASLFLSSGALGWPEVDDTLQMLAS